MKRLNFDSESTSTQYVSTAQVATALGVGVTTVKRWVDDELIPAHRTAGGHRKLLLSDVLRWIQNGKLPKADLSRLMPTVTVDMAANIDTVLKDFIAAIRSADIGKVRTMILDAYRAGMPMETIADRIIAPGMFQLGLFCENGKADIAHEHRVSQACLSTLYELDTVLRGYPDSNRPVALGGAPEHDHNSLPSLLAKIVMVAQGWNAIDLGTHTPMSAFCSAIDQLRPKLVWVSISRVENSPSFIREYTHFFEFAQRKNVAVALGGRGLTESLRSQLPYTTYGDGFTHLATFAKSLHHPPQLPLRGRPPKTPRREL